MLFGGGGYSVQLGLFYGTEHPLLVSSVSDPQFLRPGWASQT